MKINLILQPICIMESKRISKEIEFEKMYIDNIWANIIRLLNLEYRLIMKSTKQINICDLINPNTMYKSIRPLKICDAIVDSLYKLDSNNKSTIASQIRKKLISTYYRFYELHAIYGYNSNDDNGNTIFDSIDIIYLSCISENAKEINLVSKSLQESLLILFNKERKLLSLSICDIKSTLYRRCNYVEDVCNHIFSFVDRNHTINTFSYAEWYDDVVHDKLIKLIKIIYDDNFIQHITDLLYFDAEETMLRFKKSNGLT